MLYILSFQAFDEAHEAQRRLDRELELRRRLRDGAIGSFPPAPRDRGRGLGRRLGQAGRLLETALAAARPRGVFGHHV